MRLILNLLLQFAGASMVCLAFAHLGFSKLLHWQEDLQSLRMINRQVFIVHTVFLACGILMLGICGTLLWIFYTGLFTTAFLYQIGVGGFND
jgi:hypothetical protein